MLRRLALAVALAASVSFARAGDPGEEAARSYRIVTDGSTKSLPAGGKGRLVLFIEPLQKVHVHPQAPLKIRVEAPAGLAIGKTELGHKDAVDPKAEAPRFEVPFTAVARGRHEARASLDFFICSDTWCVKQLKSVAFPVDVK